MFGCTQAELIFGMFIDKQPSLRANRKMSKITSSGIRAYLSNYQLAVALNSESTNNIV